MSSNKIKRSKQHKKISKTQDARSGNISTVLVTSLKNSGRCPKDILSKKVKINEGESKYVIEFLVKG